ncbi:hypothetical protein M3223_19225 [Paenibacillus pasadenensis]|uniref:hypothetical protein n=1 Tax=Paenibacillus pasadenensis TaxID=217090 RepID=UPI0020412697|nr:hypothetical protein [Paenibacillus pasadenensis]MCM3749488.1 hypothetical protein [Paenibacillus pasadenensis]
MMNDPLPRPTPEPVRPAAAMIGAAVPAVKSDWRRLAFWMRAAAVATLMFGLFQSVIGLLNFGLGTIAGLLEVTLAVWMLRMSSQALRIEQMAESPDELHKLSRQLIIYFRLQLLFTLAFGFVVIMLVLTILQFLTDWDWLIHLVQQGRKFDKLLMKLEKWYGIVYGWFS